MWGRERRPRFWKRERSGRNLRARRRPRRTASPQTGRHPCPYTPPPRRLSRAVTLLAAGSLTLAGCQEGNVPTGGSSAAAPSAQAAASPERAALTRIDHLVALALADNGLRTRVKNDMRDSPFREHKLEFASYLHGQSGGILLSKMAEAGNLSKDDVLSLLSEVRPLEFYMPVDRDRETWTGTPDLVVVSLLQDDGSESPVGFNLEGRAVQLSLDHPPEAPVMSLVPVETDFSEPLATASVRNLDRADGEAVGSYVPMKARASIPLDTGGSGGGGSTWNGNEHQAGIYLTSSYIDDLGEPWTRGDPEEDVLIFVTDTTTGKGSRVSCASAGFSGDRHYDQNDHSWSGHALLATPSEVDAAPGDEGVWFFIVEDDDTACELVMDELKTINFISFADNLSGGFDGTGTIQGLLSPEQALFQSLLAAFDNNDDPVGVLVDVDTCSDPGPVVHTYTYTISYPGKTNNGCAELFLNE